jgi:beta-lactamase regulating signal transducer with metallopeptidase domain
MAQLLFEFIVRAALIAGATACVLRVMKVKAAAARHTAWTGVVLVMLLLPVSLTWGPKAYLRVLPNGTKASAVVMSAPFAGTAPLTPMDASAPGIQPTTRWPKLVFGLYLSGLCVLLTRLTIGTVRARRLARRAVNRAGRLTSSSCAAPVTVGWLHPVVILPEQWPQWPQAQIEAVWTHELEHARRRDPLVQWLALFNRAVFWFHPIAWWIERQLSALAEEACDTAVLGSGHDPREYSECLLDIARAVMRAGTRVNVEGMAMPGSFLRQRIRHILEGRTAPRTSRARMVCAAAACASVSVAFAAGTLAYAPKREPKPAEQHNPIRGNFRREEMRVPEAKAKIGSTISGRLSWIGPQVLLAQSQRALARQVMTAISGSWKGISTIVHQDGNEANFNFVVMLQQDGNTITGSVDLSPDERLVISNGKIDGNRVSFDVGDDQAKMTITAQLNGEKAEGSFSTVNRVGVTINGTGSGQVQTSEMTFDWSAARNDGVRFRGKLRFTKADH